MNKCYWLGHDYRETNAEDNSIVRRYCHVCKNCEEGTDHPERTKFADSFWDSDGWLYIKATSLVVLGFLAIMVLIMLVSSAISRQTCMEYMEMGIKTKWNLWTYCMGYSEKFGWLPIDQYFNSINLNIP